MRVLVLNQNFEPLNICSLRRALKLVVCNKADVLVENHLLIHTVNRDWECPSVVRLRYLVRPPLPRIQLSRQAIFRRDNYTCQYCGKRASRLSLEHVVPRHRGGGHTWENLVTACLPCNHRKGGRTLEEAGMRLLRSPFRPKATPYYVLAGQLQNLPEEWWPFLPPYLRPEDWSGSYGSQPTA
ncbi:MAG: HNH endonuclease [Chloroflexia bacterium]|nr:HNH endonuclease [Chloroflexia bacterium]